MYAANRELANYIIEETINVANIVAEKEILMRLLNNEGTESDENQLDQDLLDDVDVMLKSVKSSNFEYVPEPKDIPKPQWTKGKKHTLEIEKWQ